MGMSLHINVICDGQRTKLTKIKTIETRAAYSWTTALSEWKRLSMGSIPPLWAIVAWLCES